MLTPGNVFEEIRRRRGRSDDLIRFYWVDISTEDGGGDRDQFVVSLNDRAGTYPLCAVVLRTPGFTDANLAMNDLTEVLQSCKPDLLAADMRERISRSRYLDVALIARRDLRLAITSSPLVLPDWFPLRAKQEVTARIDDLTWTALVPLSAPEARINDLNRLLYELDDALLTRLQAVGEQDRRSVMSLTSRLSQIQRETDDFDRLMADAYAALKVVRNPRDYRPRSIGPTVISGLWRATIQSGPGQLQKLANSLATALQVVPGNIGSHAESIMAVLGRPTNPMNPEVRWTFDVIATIGAACQLATAASHADAYAGYPVRLVGAFSRDLQRALDGFVRVLGAF